MAGIGPAPKDPKQRRNKSAPMRGEWVDLPPVTEPVLPELEGDWPVDSLKLWNSWRLDPASVQWTPAEVQFARETVRLHAADEKAAEIRIRMDSLGLTPKGKRDLRWRVSEPESQPEQSASRRQSSGERRARLSLVQ